MTDSPAFLRYSAEIFRLQEENPFVQIAALAEHLDVSVQAATRTLKRLQSAGYLLHEPYRGVQLSPAGESLAMRGLRRHRLAERFLTQVMGYGWDEVHELTHQFEQGLDDTIEDRIDAMLGHPTRCPHGEPIPSREGIMPVMNDRPLTEFEAGAEVLVSRVREHDPARLRYLHKLGLTPGAQVKFLTCAPFEGPVRVMVGNTDQVIAYHLAAMLWVELPGQAG